MGIYIPKMSKDKFDKLIAGHEEMFTVIEIKAPHGRLIDENEILKIEPMPYSSRRVVNTADLHTVIDAEKE